MSNPKPSIADFMNKIIRKARRIAVTAPEVDDELHPNDNGKVSPEEAQKIPSQKINNFIRGKVKTSSQDIDDFLRGKGKKP